MEERLPIQITVYDKAYARKGVVGAPKSVNVLLLWNLPGYATFVVDRDHRRVNDLVTPGARCVVTYQPRGMSRQTILSGIVSEVTGGGGPVDGTREFMILDDLNVLNEIVGYPVPANAASSQSTSAYDTRSGPLGDVIKGFVRANATGQSVPRLTVQADAGDGPTKTVKVRMTNLGEKLLPLATAAGLGVRVIQVGTTRQLQTYTPGTYPRTLTEESGVATGVEFKITMPEVTRITVGIGGVGTARQFYGPPTTGFVDTAAEALWGIQRHEWIDARDVAQADADKATIALQRATERLAEGAAKTSLKCELMENGRLAFLKSYNVGDVMTVKPAGSAALVERASEVEIDWAEGSPEPEITPRIGDWSDSDDEANNKLVRRLSRAVEIIGTE
ncbi:hypothetical protein [Isoptericola sp. NPDC056134]|uniref:Gp37-like protein n=1 Tax=Isoptericola sp. NPDC056134 TaxID=3345723 RepID=UPI0035EA1FEC